MKLLSWKKISPFIAAIQSGNAKGLVDAAMANQAATHTLSLWPVVLAVSDAAIFLEAALRKIRVYPDPKYGLADLGQGKLRLRMLKGIQSTWLGIGLDTLVEHLEAEVFVAEALAKAKQKAPPHQLYAYN